MNKSDDIRILTLSELTKAEILYIEDRDWFMLRGRLIHWENKRRKNDEITPCCRFHTWYMKGKMSFDNMHEHVFFSNEYGKWWRCWSDLPTDKQRKEMKWND